ncbi:caspase-5 isoform X2 [Petromyzon marinus]|uniref:Caspase-1-A-like isoform X2 n=1 Tax=Petromyzon marinus TaxID=7757 RepID=A0AAJ7TAM9_PETMA|nr:caspase-1-A-like isoform X2 [Petromyzon marinus]
MSGDPNLRLIKKYKVHLRTILYPSIKEILDRLDAEDIINHSEYIMLDEKPRAELPRFLLDHLIDMGEGVCTRFLKETLLPYCRENTPLRDRLMSETKPVYEVLMTLKTDVTDSVTSGTERVKASREDFYNSTKGEEYVYRVRPRGPARQRQALIINNMNFTGEGLLKRNGSEEDVKYLVWLFKELDYTPIVHKDQSAEEIENLVKKFAKMDEHMHSDSTFVVVMSHGCNRGVFGKGKNDLLSIETIYTALNNNNCPGLKDKPKIIIVQACRVDIATDSAAPKEVVDANWETGGCRVPRESDMTCLYSTLPDDVSYRSRIKGSFLIQHLVEVMKEHACTEHVQELFTRVKDKCSMKDPPQMPVDERNSLRRRFYLFPGF